MQSGERKAGAMANETKVDPTRLTVPQLVTLLKKSGAKHVKTETIETHVTAGAPVNADGTIHLIHYTAWLAQAAG